MNPSQDKVKELINNLTRAELLEACVRYAEEKVRRKARKIGAAAMEDRLTKLEDVVSNEMARTREMDAIPAGVVKRVSARISVNDPVLSDDGTLPGSSNIHRMADPDTSKPSAYGVWFDKDASPSGIPFSVALEYLKAGRTVCRGNWLNRARVEPRGPGAVGGLRIIHDASLDYGTFEPCLSDLLATNWMVLPQEPAKP